jgi:hypothetical protein
MIWLQVRILDSFLIYFIIMKKTYKHPSWIIATQCSTYEPMWDITKEWESSELLFTTKEIISFWFEEVRNIVPDNIKFMWIKFMWSYDMPIWLQFGKEEQILYYRDTWKVTNNQKWWWSELQCKLEQKKLSDVKIWDFVVDTRWSIDNEKSYILVTKINKDWYEWMFYNNRVICYMSISALSSNLYVVVPLYS